ncbi:tetratricopeptide repeat protein [Uliginosibacterium sp. TH139]|uniref:tetratricopeptide repeat protein n=1 Tax=Uliginosibacterium sp. TH139 TaxID=2067453 RepID=UPI000C7A6418|nr:tetratricopeptide repeat protein [Uliginosibacterium sp. TH139]PLK47193.1 sulfotransferase [Uliginosibacterium sp. TH139]
MTYLMNIIHGLLEQAVQSYAQGELAVSEARCKSVLQMAPAAADALNLLGLIAGDRGQDEAAERFFRDAQRADPEHPGPWINLGMLLRRKSRLEEALACYDNAIRLHASLASVHFNRANLLEQMQRLEEAEAAYLRAIELEPGDVAAYNNCGALLWKNKRFEDSLPFFERALALEPGNAEAWLNKGSSLKDLGRIDEALEAFAEARRLRPAFSEASFNLACSLHAMGKVDEALAAYAEARNDPAGFAEATWNEALCRLLKGDYAEGWRLYESRWLSCRFPPPRQFPQPLWAGEADLAGKTILLHAEQGFGDAIQFVRYAPLVAERGARVILAAHSELIPLFESVEGAAAVLNDKETLPAFDLHCPLMSLPRAFRTELDTIPARASYLAVTPPRRTVWQARLQDLSAGLRIGLAWAGNPANVEDAKRSMPLAALEPLLRACQASGSTIVSLQKALTEDDRERLEAFGGRDFAADRNDFLDTAALVEQLDLVISVDSAAAHLAGALGKPVWIALCTTADWRWLQERSDSPWYPSARLFRQTQAGDWSGVVAQLVVALAGFRP